MAFENCPMAYGLGYGFVGVVAWLSLVLIAIILVYIVLKYGRREVQK